MRDKLLFISHRVVFRNGKQMLTARYVDGKSVNYIVGFKNISHFMFSLRYLPYKKYWVSITVHQLLQPNINGTQKHDCRKHYSVQLHDILETALRSLCHGQEDNQRFHTRFMAYLILLKSLNLNLSRNKELNILSSNVAEINK